MKFLILVNSTSLGNIHLHKMGLCFRPITISEYEEIVSYLDRLVSDELVETVLSIKVDGMSDTMIYYSIAISSRNERLSHLQTEFLKMIAYKKSKKAAIYEFI